MLSWHLVVSVLFLDLTNAPYAQLFANLEGSAHNAFLAIGSSPEDSSPDNFQASADRLLIFIVKTH